MYAILAEYDSIGYMLKNHIPTFLALIVLIVMFQFLLLGPIMGQGLTNEDYVGLFTSRVLQKEIETNTFNTWLRLGPHQASHTFYIHFLDQLFGENYRMYLLVGIFFKVIATAVLYPLIFLLFRNKTLAFLSTLIYGLSFAAAGALAMYVVSDEYLGLFLVNLSLIFYCLILKKTKVWLLILLTLFLSAGFVLSSIRVYPIIFIISLVEFYILVKNKFSNLLSSIVRIAVIILPVVVILFISSQNTRGDAYSLVNLPVFIKLITDGNWYLLLNPVWGLGYTFLPFYDFVFLGDIRIFILPDYICSLFTAFCIFGLFTFFLSLFFSKKPLRFLFTFMLINILLDIVVYVVITHHLSLPPGLMHGYDPITFRRGLYSNIFAAFIFSFSITCFIEWYKNNRKYNLLFVISVAPFLALLFIIGQWIFTRHFAMYSGGMHRYFVIPAIGTSLFAAGIMTVILKSGKKLRLFTVPLIIFCLIIIFNISKKEIAIIFDGKKLAGQDLKVQEFLKNQTVRYIPKNKLKDNMLFYIKFASDTGAASHWEETFDWRNFLYWMHVKKSYLTGKISGCIVMTWDSSELQKMARIQNGSKGFLFKTGGSKDVVCSNNGIVEGGDGVFYKLDDFYALTIDEMYVGNITEDVINKIVFK